MLLAAHEQSGSLSDSLASISTLIGARCRVLPMSDVPATLVARHADGRIVHGQSILTRTAGPLARVWTLPEIVRPAPGVLDAIASAQIIVLGPGSLFSSVIAATRAAGIARAIDRSSALKILVQNLTTQRGETDGFGVVEHVRAVKAHLGEHSLDVVLSHRWIGEAPPQGVPRDPGVFDSTGVRDMGARLADRAAQDRLHHPRRLAAALLRLAHGRLSPAQRRVMA
jgi:uncharacterized cofD-like protein